MSTISPNAVTARPAPALPFWDRVVWNLKALVALALLAGAACVGWVGKERAGTPPVQSGVVPITSGSGYSSGVIISDGIVVTSHHGTRAGSVTAAWCSATVVASDPSVDLALLKVADLKGDSVPIAGPKDEVTGEAVMYGLPGGFGYKATRCSVDEKGKLTQDAIPGNSGGPLMKNGKLVGIVLTTRGVATAAQIRAFVTKAGYPWLVPN